MKSSIKWRTKQFLNRNIEDEKEAIRKYGRKPKGLDGAITSIRKDEKRHLKKLQQLKQGYRSMK